MPKVRSCIIVVIVIMLLGCAGLLGLRVIFGGGLRLEGSALAHEGVPIVEAIYKFKAAHGLWPQRLDDLVPEELANHPDQKWDYWWRDWGSISLDARGFIAGATYNFDGEDEGWRVWRNSRDSEWSERLSIVQPKPPMPVLSSDEWRQRKLAELDRRIKRDPTELSHWKMKIAQLAGAKEWDQAIATCRDALVQLPDSCHLHLTLAYALAAANPASDAVAEIQNWICQKPTFVRYWCLFRFYQDHNQTVKALDALHAAAESPWAWNDTKPKDMIFTNDALGYSTACYALQQRDFDLALTLCDCGEKAGYGCHGPPDYLAVRAAAHLAKGEQSVAIEEAKQVLAESKQQALWAGHLDELLNAAEAGDRSFTYDGSSGCCNMDLHLFTCYE